MVFTLAKVSSSWVTPLWLISSGAALGFLILALIITVLWFVARSFGDEIIEACRETFLKLLAILCLALLVVAITTSLFIVEIGTFLAAVKEYPSLGEKTQTVSIPADAKGHFVHLSDHPQTLVAVSLASDTNLIVVAEGKVGKKKVENTSQTYDLESDKKLHWTEKSQYKNPLHFGLINLAITNPNSQAVDLTIDTNSKMTSPQIWAIPITAGCLIVVVLFYLLIRQLFPKMAAIAYATTKEAVSQPIFLIVMVVGILALLTFIYIPYGTFGEDIKMLKKNGVPWIVVLSMIIALWTASTSIADELEGKTALTVLSKPLTRRTFILGKFVGIVWVVVLMFILLGLVFMATVSYKLWFDAPGAAARNITWQMCYTQVASIIPGLVLGCMETIVIASISVAISTRLPMVANMIICVTIYALGHLVPLVVNSSQGEFAIVRFMGNLIATILPVLDHFQTEAAVVVDGSVPLDYLLWAGLYSLLYCTIAMLVALALFEDRDLA